jgi:ATP-dependent protease HslVU (ClpYQ) peptidase subunit
MLEDDDPFPLDEKDFEAMVVVSKNSVRYYNSKGYWDAYAARYHAIGSGAPFALAAMEGGASAVKAVKVAIKIDVWSGGRIRSLELKR